MLWVAIEALTAPLPVLWREAAPAEPPRFLGDCSFVNVLTGESRDEHPLLGTFRDFVAYRRAFGAGVKRKFAHYDSARARARACAARRPRAAAQPSRAPPRASRAPPRRAACWVHAGTSAPFPPPSEGRSMAIHGTPHHPSH